MAHPKKRLTTNAAGNFFVDATCINCDTCRQLAPKSFKEEGDYSAVARQPEGDAELLQAYQALLACPVGSIGTEQSDKARLQEAMKSFPLLLEDGVYYNGFNSEKSFGGNSYFIRHPDGNWLVDSPRYVGRLIKAFEEMGGIRTIFLTHEDDVADSARYAEHFGATRIIHRADAAASPGAERIVDGEEPIVVSEPFQIIPVPGHTEGSMALLYDGRFLFSGDHLWWDPERNALGAPERLVWDGERLLTSVAKLRGHPFEWVLPGHGDRIRLTPAEAAAHLDRLLERRRAARP
ncbi:MBL fold metallo-hydrolase [Candidatus Manganitrophus noduliformans]|uniref:MBL fold metallo-hydrolase n=1 Tax=Candidatus Manganitrophus noduliformans TaxID=2606439 RepID=A0A7X6IDA8_9BACT|nr:MBL fold metallo-hydrolase [Candidatus Manganitrophus noduliformans]NKE73401.1 MBL fold metallo-hydrolase [Candidatus Manganitrophus noduliformans]